MPIYEYKCNVCGKTEELLENLSSCDCHACSACGAVMAMERQCSVPTVNTSEACKPTFTDGSPSCKGSGCNCPFAR